MEELRSAFTQEELERLAGELDVERAAELRARFSSNDQERLDALWRRIPSSGRSTILIARPVDHPTVFAEFLACDEIASGRAEDRPRWRLKGYLARTPSDEVILERLVIEPWDQGQPGITSETLRGISPMDIVVGAREYLAIAPDVLALEHELGVQAEKASPRRGRPPLYDDDFYEALARELIADSENGRGVLGRAADRRKRNWETMRRWAREATERGFLAERGPGQSAFKPGWKLAGEYWETPEQEAEANALALELVKRTTPPKMTKRQRAARRQRVRKEKRS
jgi:hypothetical protein